MKQHEHNLNLMISLAETFFPNNPGFKLTLLLLEYTRRKFDELVNAESFIHRVPDEILEKIIEQRRNVDGEDTQPGYECCVSGKPNATGFTKPEGWHYLCSKKTRKKYQVFVSPSNDCQNGEFVVSETMYYNARNALGHELDERSFFVMSVEREMVPIATEAKISMISNTFSCSDEFLDCLLRTFFRVARCVRSGDVVAVDTRMYAPDYFYSSTNNCPRRIHFRVDSAKVGTGNVHRRSRQACYVIKGETSLVRSSDIFAFAPHEFLETPKMDLRLPLRVRIEMFSHANYPPSLKKPLARLSACVSPFLQKGKVGTTQEL